MADVKAHKQSLIAELINPATDPLPGTLGGAGPAGPRYWGKSARVCQAAQLVPHILTETTAPQGQHGMTHLLTGNPVRAAQDDCRHHVAGWMVDSRGWTRPVMCSGNPATAGQFPGAAYSVGQWFIAENSTRVLNNGWTLNEGFAYGMIPYENPQTYLMMWDSHPGLEVPV